MANIALEINVEETDYVAPTEWRMLGAEGKAEHVIELCKRNDLKPLSVLEVGAGDGAILRYLGDKSFCAAMHAIEISQSGVDVILKQNIPGLISCQTFDGYKIPFEDNAFDLVILSHVLEHVEFERALLREIRRVSKYQLIEIPMDCNALGNTNYQFLGPSYGHINAHTPDALRFLLSTEMILVLDELLGGYSLPLLEYDHFVNNSHERTPEAIARFRNDYQHTQQKFEKMPRSAKIGSSSFYAVLSKREDSKEKNPTRHDGNKVEY